MDFHEQPLITGHFLFSRCYEEEGLSCFDPFLPSAQCTQRIFDGQYYHYETYDIPYTLVLEDGKVQFFANTSVCTWSNGVTVDPLSPPPPAIDPLWFNAFSSLPLFAPAMEQYVVDSSGQLLPDLLLYSSAGEYGS